MKPVSRSCISSSRSSCVNVRLQLRPPSSAVISVTTSVESRSLAARHCSRSAASCPTPAVLAGSRPLPCPSSSNARSCSSWSISSPDSAVYRIVALTSSKSPATITRVAEVPLPPKSSSPTTPSSGRPSSDFTAVSAAMASLTSRGAMPLRTKPRWVRNASRSACTVPGFQCAGTAMEISEDAASAPAASTIASSASTVNSSGSCAEPSGDTSATESPMRSTKPFIGTPGSARSGFSSGAPIFGAQCG
ncbi:hypothetical protein PICSAR81_02717 [Mycobacterium avium subsp. paratuberculosis]|nr:hypothetical protein PICSAR81_02717 [Mycobacterium avium subsp. paratuberculosis]